MSSLKIVYIFSNTVLFFYFLFLLPHFLLSAGFNNNRFGEEPPETPLYNKMAGTSCCIIAISTFQIVALAPSSGG